MENSEIKLQNVRLSFPQLFEAKSFDANGKKEFSASFLLPKNDPQVEVIKAKFMELATAKWGDDAAKIIKGLFATDKLCLHDGDNKDYDGYEGHFFVRANNKIRPTVLNRDKSPLNEEDGVIYSGCYVNAIVGLWVQDNGFGKRINANLKGVQFFRDGEPFSGGGVASADQFEAHDAPAEETVGSSAGAMADLGF